jgi:glycosyltransferase involved in cell wall biosynthesis
MRILVLTNMYPPHAFGGYEASCQDVVRWWRRWGHEVEVLTSDVRVPGVRSSGEDRSDVRRDLHLYWRDHAVLDPPVWRRFLWEHSNQRALSAVLDELQPEVASAWAMGAMSLGLLTRLQDLGLPVVAVVCDEWPAYAPVVDGWTRPLVSRPRLGRVVELVTRLPARLPDADAMGPTCFVSDAMRTRNRELSQWSFPTSAVVPSGIDLEDFPLASPSAERPPWRWRLLHVGRIDPRKGLSTVVEALALCPSESTLELLGTGDESHLAELQGLALDLGVADRVRIGSCPRQELAPHYRAADVVVFAPVWHEPFGLVPLEAMACGTPVVASPTGGSKEFLVDGVNCIAFPPGEAAGLAAALRRLAHDAKLRRSLVGEGLRTAARFTTEKLARELESWHRLAATGSLAPAPR